MNAKYSRVFQISFANNEREIKGTNLGGRILSSLLFIFFMLFWSEYSLDESLSNQCLNNDLITDSNIEWITSKQVEMIVLKYVNELRQQRPLIPFTVVSVDKAVC